ncbi:hypothetical protein H312_01397 [Anncaliia algerae PRA339]|uniref:DH domain-containing protein n=1 Tax=Anncaliia algerae PRA339 TaxID=1288291 RepID=A0A059F255_9MICR|nr:hypothetical protein H312_01397 [Anncaliia algerae PRA339]
MIACPIMKIIIFEYLIIFCVFTKGTQVTKNLSQNDDLEAISSTNNLLKEKAIDSNTFVYKNFFKTTSGKIISSRHHNISTTKRKNIVPRSLCMANKQKETLISRNYNFTQDSKKSKLDDSNSKNPIIGKNPLFIFEDRNGENTVNNSDNCFLKSSEMNFDNQSMNNICLKQYHWKKSMVYRFNSTHSFDNVIKNISEINNYVDKMPENNIKINKETLTLSSEKHSLHLYTPKNSSDNFYNSCKAIEDIAKYINYIRIIENDNFFSFSLLINSVNRNMKNLKNHYNFILHLQPGFDEFYGIMSKKYLSEEIIRNQEHELFHLCDEFFKFEKWITETYNLKNLDITTTTSNHYESYVRILRKNDNFQKINILKMYVDVLNSDNYKLLFQLIPGFNFIKKIENITSVKSQIVLTIRYLQLIIMKFETFRFNHLYKNKILMIDLEYLFSNDDFKETIAIITNLYKKIILLCKNTTNILEMSNVYSFLLFVRAKYNEIFQKLNLSEAAFSVDFNEDDTIKCKFKDHKFLTPQLLEKLNTTFL